MNIVKIMVCHLIERYATTLKIGPNKIQIKYTRRMKKKKERKKKNKSKLKQSLPITFTARENT